MSGIVGILHSDGAPVDSDLLGRLTEFLSFRGPDAQQIWTAGHVGFGHTLLRTTYESAQENQPLSLDGKTWIVADARVDARQDLIKKLRSTGLENLSAATDPELILRAYQVWDEQCVDHLLGDFAFAIWDASRERLFCARDQMGVKPFFYAHLGPLFLFSNTLDCIRQHPAVSNELNDLAIADFLLFDMNQDPATTSFADIQRLPPAHTLICEAGRVSLRRYWTLSVTTPVHFSRDEEYVERFRELLDTVVGDRLRMDNVGVFMSGGLDSPTVAASAKRVLSRKGAGNGVRAYTDVFDSLIPHEERHYAGLVAKALDIPIQFHSSDNAQLFGSDTNPEYRSPEPEHCAWPDDSGDRLRQIGQHSRIALTGFGADPAFSSRITVHFRYLLKSGHFGQALRDATRYLMTENRLSRLYLRTRCRLLFTPKSRASSYPPWLNEEFESRLGLRDRWANVNHGYPPEAAVRPEAWGAIVGTMWFHLFESYDAGITGVPVEIRHPFFDLRLLNFLLALPRLPWCSDKQLLREAARGVLPDAVRVRRKAPLAAEPTMALILQPNSAWVDRFDAAPPLERFVRRNRIPPVFSRTDYNAAWINLRPLSLNYWLKSAWPAASKTKLSETEAPVY